ncbi:hypothetical protein [Nostoc sp.]
MTRCFPKQEPLDVARFRRHNNAVAYLQVLQGSVKDIRICDTF